MASYNDLLTLLQQIDETLSTLSARLQINPQQIVLSGLADISKNMGLIQAGEFRVGNSIEPGLGFTGGRFGYPGFSYNGSLWFLAGVQDDVLKTGMSIVDGKLYAENATISGSLTAHSGFIGSWEISSTQIKSFPSGFIGIVLDSEFALIQVGDVGGTHIQIDGSNQRIRSSNFVAGASGFNISAITGDAEFNNITARGELKTFLLTSSNQMAVAGNILVSKDAGKLGAAVAAADTTVNFGKAMTVGDWIKIQGPDTAGTASIEWMLVGTLVSGTTYNVTRNVDGSGANNWAKDTPFVVIGANGDSRIEITAGATGSIQLITQGATWNTQTVQASMSTVDGAIVAGAGTVNLDTRGVVIDNAAPSLIFETSTGAANKIYLNATATDRLEVRNNVLGGSVDQVIELTNGLKAFTSMKEDTANVNVAQFDLSLGTVGSKISIGSDVIIWAKKTGEASVFNAGKYDVDFVIYGAVGEVFRMDAGDERIEIGLDHYIPTRNATNKNIFFNEANQDMDFAVEGDTSSQVLYIDAGLDKATSFAWDGWQQMDQHTWTRTGNHSFTVSGDVTAVYRKGTKVRYKDGGGSYEYGVILSSSHSAGTTTVTLAANTDYAMAAATITDRYLSYVADPEGFPQWFNMAAPSLNVSYFDNGSGGQPTLNAARWSIQGTTCTLAMDWSGYKATGDNNIFVFASSYLPQPRTSVMTGRWTLGSFYISTAAFVFYAGWMILYTDGNIYGVTFNTIADNTQFLDVSALLVYEI